MGIVLGKWESDEHSHPLEQDNDMMKGGRLSVYQVVKRAKWKNVRKSVLSMPTPAGLNGSDDL